MANIVLATANARYSHTAFGLRYLYANLGSLRDQCALREFTIAQSAGEIAESLLKDDPRIIGLGVYIWNVELLTQVGQILKAVRPETILILGGPEASYEYEHTPLFAAADYLIRGEADTAFRDLAQQLLDGHSPAEKVITPAPPDLAALAPPYDAYTEHDIARRTVYVEASRGCPFQCEFCLSALDAHVREVPLETFLASMESLLARGVRHFRFVDRTFNLKRERVERILDFFEERWQDGMMLHFEVVPDALSDALLQRMARFPNGGLHLEVGIQSIHPEALAAVSRKQDNARALSSLAFLRTQSGVILHTDLVAGLPGESWATFAAAFDTLIEVGPQELQVGILKRLKGARIARRAETYSLRFADYPPYEILQTDRIDFVQMQRIKRFARYFDLYYNSGNFPATLPLLMASRASAYEAFMDFSDTLWRTTGKTHAIPLAEQARLVFEYLVNTGMYDPTTLAEVVESDFRRLSGRKDKLQFLQA